MKYVCHLLLKQTKKNEKYPELKPIYQICIDNFDIFKKGKFIYKSYIMEEKLHEKRNDFITIIDINLDFLKKMEYTKVKEAEEESLEKLLYIFICKDKKILDKIYSESEIMEKVREKISCLTEDFAEELYYNKEEIINDYSFDMGKEAGLKEGELKGIKQNKIETAKKLLSMGMKIEDIIKATELTKEEIEELQK